MGVPIAQIEGRQLHLVKKALAIATLAIEDQRDGPFRPPPTKPT
jgi:hypothetical protein